MLNEIGINTHVMPGVYILVDVAVSATPRRLAHAYQPMLFIGAYTLFNLVYYLCGGLVSGFFFTYEFCCRECCGVG